MRLFNHFYFRYIANRIGNVGADPNAGFLKADDSWVAPYYRRGNAKQKQRLYFAAP